MKQAEYRISSVRAFQIIHISGGLNHLPYLLSISVWLAVIKDFSTNYMKALRLNQAYT